MMSNDDLSRAIGRIEGKMDEALDTLKSMAQNHSDRLNVVEAKQNRQTGYLLGLSAALSAFWHYIPKIFAGIAQ